MLRQARYAATIYFGLMMSGTLARPGWVVSHSAAASSPTSPLMKLAPQKVPYRYKGAADATDPAPPAPPSPPNAADLLR